MPDEILILSAAASSHSGIPSVAWDASQTRTSRTADVWMSTTDVRESRPLVTTTWRLLAFLATNSARRTSPRLQVIQWLHFWVQSEIPLTQNPWGPASMHVFSFGHKKILDSAGSCDWYAFKNLHCFSRSKITLWDTESHLTTEIGPEDRHNFAALSALLFCQGLSDKVDQDTCSLFCANVACFHYHVRSSLKELSISLTRRHVLEVFQIGSCWKSRLPSWISWWLFEMSVWEWVPSIRMMSLRNI